MDLLEIIADGHILANETVNEGIRKVTEELGIKISYEHMDSLGY